MNEVSKVNNVSSGLTILLRNSPNSVAQTDTNINEMVKDVLEGTSSEIREYSGPIAFSVQERPSALAASNYLHLSQEKKNQLTPKERAQFEMYCPKPNTA
jgi:PP-loop superfamily ATP-utilizing enzyme